MSDDLVPAAEILGNQVAAQIQFLYHELDTALGRIRDLLRHAGSAGHCRGCGAPIFWVRHIDSGRNAPYNFDGSNHFATCPGADQFRKEKHG